MRDGWDKESFFLQVNWGKYGGGHTHPDILSVNACAFGVPMLIEASRFDTYDNPLMSCLRSPEAHNQVTLLGATLDRKASLGEEIVWRDGRKVAYFEGMHRGYETSAGRFLKRQVLFVKGEYWLVVDTILGAKRAQAANAVLNWHSPRPWQGTPRGPATQVVVWPDITPEFKTEYENTTEFYKSRYRASWTQPATDGAQFVTLIAPCRESPISCRLEKLRSDAGCLAVRIARQDRTDYALFATTAKGKALSSGVVSTDARAAWFRESPFMAAMVDGSRLASGVRVILTAKPGQGIAETPSEGLRR